MLIQFHDAAVAPLWSSLNLAVDRGEFIAVLGPNGVGKSTLLGTILGTRKLTAGSVDVNCRVGFIPQQRMFPADLPLRARDLVSLSLAHGAFRRRRPPRHRVDELLAEVGATGLRDRRVGQLSGGQQQLIRQAKRWPMTQSSSSPMSRCSRSTRRASKPPWTSWMHCAASAAPPSCLSRTASTRCSG